MRVLHVLYSVVSRYSMASNSMESFLQAGRQRCDASCMQKYCSHSTNSGSAAASTVQLTSTVLTVAVDFHLNALLTFCWQRLAIEALLCQLLLQQPQAILAAWGQPGCAAHCQSVQRLQQRPARLHIHEVAINSKHKTERPAAAEVHAEQPGWKER